MQILYTNDELIQNFSALLGSYDFAYELDLFKLGKMQFLKKKRVRRELLALYMALWKLALDTSFPDEADCIFDEYLSRYSNSAKGGQKEMDILKQKIDVYGTLLQKHKDRDFSPIAAFMGEMLIAEEAGRPKVELKLALAIRSMYSIIFARLV